jgi:polysaccharide biosynthesis transport protein
MDDEQIERTNLTLEQAVGVVRRRYGLIVLCCVVVGAAAFGYSEHKAKQYTATAALTFNNNTLSQQVAGLSVPSSASTLQDQQDSDLELVKLGNMAAATAAQLGLAEETVAKSISVAGQGESNTVVVSSTSPSPTLAAEIATTYARQFVKEQQSTNGRFFRSALALVNKQLARMTPAQRFGTDGLDLQDRAQTLRLLAELGYNNAELAEEALVPSSPSSPKVKKDTLVGVVVGLVLGLALAFLLEHLDARIREPEDLEGVYRLPMLGVVPKSQAFVDGRGKALPHVEAEAFSLACAHLRFFNVDRDVRTILIASPAPGDGKSTIARHLAEAAAKLGSRVLLLEADLRRPTLAQRLGLDLGQGLAGTLIGAVTFSDAVRTIALYERPGDGVGGHTLDVLPAGAVAPNPGELLESRAMEAVLQQAKSAYDLVVIDTPPLCAVSDAFPLLTAVDGVVIVGWVRRSRRDAAEELQQILSGSAAKLLGVIANGAKAGTIASYSESSGHSSSAAPTAGQASSVDDLVSAAER